MKKKLICSVLCAAMLLSSAACSSSASSTTPVTESTSATTEIVTSTAEDTTAATTAAAEEFAYNGEPVTLSVMAVTSGAAEGENFYVDILPELVHEKFPNITIETEELPTNDYKSTVKMKFASGEGPDIFRWWAGQQAQSLVDAGYLRPLGDLELLSDFRTDMVESYSFDGVPYAVPLGLSFLTTWYNKDVFKEVGITSEPTNWQEFMTICQTLEDAGYMPLVEGAKDSYTTQFGAYQIGASAIYADTENFDSLLYTGETSFTDAGWLDTITKYSELYSNDYVLDGALGISHQQARQAFIDGKAVMTMDGSFGWSALTAEGEAGAFERGMFCIPANDEGEEFVYNMTPSNGIFASAQNSDHEEAIMAVLRYWFTEGTDLFTAWAEYNEDIPAHNSLTDSRPLIQEYVEKYAAYDSVWNLNNAWPDGVSDAMTTKLQDLIADSAAPEDVVEAMQNKFLEVTE